MPFNTYLTCRHSWFTIRSTTMFHYLHQMTQHAPNRKWLLFKFTKYLQYGLLLLEMTRIVYLSYLLAIEGPIGVQEHQPYNPLMTYLVAKYHFLNSETLLATSLLILFVIALNYTVCFKFDPTLLEQVHELMIDNSVAFLAFNRRRLGSEVGNISHRRPLQMVQGLRLCTTIWGSKNLKFKNKILRCFPHLSLQLRARIVLYSSAIEWIFAASDVIAGFILLAFELGVLNSLYHDLPLPQMILATVDITFILYLAWDSIRICHFVIHVFLLFSFTSDSHLTELNASLCCLFQKGYRKLLAQYRFLRHFTREYHQLRSLAEYCDRQLISQLLGVTFVANIPLNVVMMGHLVFRSLYFGEKLVMIVLVCLQTWLGIQASLTLVSWSQCLTSSEGLLFTAQGQLGPCGRKERLYRKVLIGTAKIKLMGFYEMFCTRNEFRFTIGPIARMSKKGLSEFLLAYSGAIMYVSKIIIKNGNI